MNFSTFKVKAVVTKLNPFATIGTHVYHQMKKIPESFCKTLLVHICTSEIFSKTVVVHICTSEVSAT